MVKQRPNKQRTCNRGPIRVLIVDDHGLFRDLMYRVFGSEDGLDVVGAAEDGPSAIEMSRQLKPDVVIMDIEMPGEIDGIGAALEIKSERPETGILFLSAHIEKQYLQNIPLGRETGWSYLLKHSLADTESLLRAIEGCAHGLVVLDPAIVGDLRDKDNSRLSNLTPRQLEVLARMAEGYSNSAIASMLHLGEKTVQNYNNAIFQELRLTGETEIHARVKAALIYAEETWAY